MRHPPYHEIINIKEECKEYARLCNGKSNKFKLYTEWEDHIKGLLSDFRSPKDLYNFNATVLMQIGLKRKHRICILPILVC